LYLDIETSPILAYTWGLFEQDALETLEPWIMLSFAYCWGHERKVVVKALPDYTSYYAKNPKCDRLLVQELHRLLSQCDIAIAHNGDQFDFKKSSSRFIYHKMDPPPPFKTIDTLKLLRKFFRLDSNRLDSACAYLGLGRKLATQGKSTWLGCLNGDPKAWKTMRAYNKHDVTLLVALYDYIKAWAAPSLPNLALYTGRPCCPACGSTRIQKRGLAYSKVTLKQRFYCLGCGGWHTGERIKNK
jgi:uncharacterized protein YprB with RNaseH-like and TPR domain